LLAAEPQTDLVSDQQTGGRACSNYAAAVLPRQQDGPQGSSELSKSKKTSTGSNWDQVGGGSGADLIGTKKEAEEELHRIRRERPRLVSSNG